MAFNGATFMQSSVSILKHLGERIRARRISAELTQAMLARRAGASRDTVTRIERGENIGVTALLRIAIALDASPEFGALFPKRDLRSLDEVLAAQRKRQRVRRGRPAAKARP